MLVLNLLIISLALFSCYKQERFTFQEGKYEYLGEQIVFYDDIKINYLSLCFRSESTEYEETNILVNRKNNASFYVDFYIENEMHEGFYCKFISQEKVGDQIDRYYIKLDVSNLINLDDSIIHMVLEFYNSSYLEDRQKNEANEIYLSVKSFNINGINEIEYYFPSRLKLVYVG